MPAKDTIIQDHQSAAGYDEQARKTNWLGPEVIFGLSYEFVKPGQSVLDLGIGSGLSSILFHKAGLKVSGLDGSSEVLEVCAAKNFTNDLQQHDLRILPLPYPDGSYHHILAVAVLNSFQDLSQLFKDISRILKDQGLVAFTVEEQKHEQDASYRINRVEVAEQPDDENAVRLFRHSDSYIRELLELNDLSLLKSLEFLAFEYPAENINVYFKAYLAQKHSLTTSSG